MHGATLLDKNGGVIRPCLLWNDTRAYIEASEMDSMNCLGKFLEILFSLDLRHQKLPGLNETT